MACFKKKNPDTFLDFSMAALNVEFFVVGDCLVLCRMFSSTPASNSLDASSTSFLPVVPIKNDIAKCPLGAKLHF